MTDHAGWKLENSYLKLPDVFYERVNPNPVSEPELVIYNKDLGERIGLSSANATGNEKVEIFAGNKLPPNAVPIAQSYAGHQFGHFTMLGDGRAMLLGEQITPEGKHLDVQLKGAGPTAYSRGGDGRAALGPMLREYIISEAMHGLNIPTSRGLAVVKTGEEVRRETMLEGAILTRVADSHLRVGTFQFAARFGELSDLTALAGYAMERHYPALPDAVDPYRSFLKAVIDRQAALIAQWQLAGFIHGVMNTDNMTISGETIDYGPCAFMDVYQQKTVFSSIDQEGRYAYMNQPGIAGWNLARFAEALLPLLHGNKDEALKVAQQEIEGFGPRFHHYWYSGMRAKLGIFHEAKEDAALIENLLSMMQHYHADYTNTFLALTFDHKESMPMAQMKEFREWEAAWKARLKKQEETDEETESLMRNSNPALIPRNQWVEEALEAAVKHDDYTVMKDLLKINQNPYAHTEEQKAFAEKTFASHPAYQTFCGT